MTRQRRERTVRLGSDLERGHASFDGPILHRVIVEIECPHADRLEAVSRLVADLVPTPWHWRSAECGCATGTASVFLRPLFARPLEGTLRAALRTVGIYPAFAVVVSEATPPD